MNIEFTGRHFSVTPALREHAAQRLEKIARYIDQAQEAHVTLEVSKRRHIAEVQVVGRREQLSGQGETGDMYASLKLVLDRIERQAKKQRKKRLEVRRRRSRGTAQAEPVEPAPSAPTQVASLTAIVETRPLVPPQMSVEEALLSIDGSDQPFVLFRDQLSERLNLLYRRPDGRFGMIEAQV